jgi:hypothetical protein
MQSDFSRDTSELPPTLAGPACRFRDDSIRTVTTFGTIELPLERAAEALEILPFAAV